ncbi:50S ribosomal protein L19, chloroplastic [Hordeum vulgare]|nr:50S ribosomal protein L19, chloroplastic [Hordeum vulgare]
MAGSGFESFTSRSVDHELIPHGLEEEMVVRLALRPSREMAPRIMQRCGGCNRVMVDIIFSQGGSVIDLMSTGTFRVTGSEEEE